MHYRSYTLRGSATLRRVGEHLLQPPVRVATPTRTHYLVLKSMKSWVRMTLLRRRQENTALLSSCGLAGTPLRVSLLGLGGKERTGGVHSADVELVGLPTLPQAEAELFVWDQRPFLAGA